MNKLLFALLALLLVLGMGTAAEAQVPYYTYYGPTDYVTYYAPTTTVYSGYTAYSSGYVAAPVVTYRPVTPTVVYRPTTVVTYRPVVPTTVYSVPVYAAPAPVYVGRQKYYVPGQPVRNVLRAITPGVPVYAY